MLICLPLQCNEYSYERYIFILYSAPQLLCGISLYNLYFQFFFILTKLLLLFFVIVYLEIIWFGSDVHNKYIARTYFISSHSQIYFYHHHLFTIFFQIINNKYNMYNQLLSMPKKGWCYEWGGYGNISTIFWLKILITKVGLLFTMKKKGV